MILGPIGVSEKNLRQARKETFLKLSGQIRFAPLRFPKSSLFINFFDELVKDKKEGNVAMGGERR